jgi:hypothetical protein
MPGTRSLSLRRGRLPRAIGHACLVDSESGRPLVGMGCSEDVRTELEPSAREREQTTRAECSDVQAHPVAPFDRHRLGKTSGEESSEARDGAAVVEVCCVVDVVFVPVVGSGSETVGSSVGTETVTQRAGVTQSSGRGVDGYRASGKPTAGEHCAQGQAPGDPPAAGRGRVVGRGAVAGHGRRDPSASFDSSSVVLDRLSTG